MEKIKKSDANKIRVEKRAMQKIEMSINDIFYNKRINDEIEEIKRIFKVQNNFFAEEKLENDSDDIIGLLNSCKMRWHNKIIENNELLNQVIENIIQDDFEIQSRPKYLGKKFTDKWEHAPAKRKIIEDSNKKNYIFIQFEKYLYDINVNICKPKFIDQNIWRTIAGAKLFGISDDRVLKCKRIILDRFYFPTINEKLQIQIHELTSIEDVKQIWPMVQEKQKSCRLSMGETNLKIFSKVKGKTTDYPSAKRNKRAYEIREENPGFENKDIMEKLIDEKLAVEGDFEISYIPVMIKKHENIINKHEEQIRRIDWGQYPKEPGTKSNTS